MHSIALFVCVILSLGNVALGMPGFKLELVGMDDGFQVAVCIPGQDYIPAEDCTRYYNCTTGAAVPSRCGLGLYWNPDINACDFPSSVDECIGGVRPVTPQPSPGTDIPVTGVTDYSQPSTTEEEDPDIDCGDVDFGFLPHMDCTKYYNCTNHVGVVYRCYLGLVWNPRINACDFPAEVPECVGLTRWTTESFNPTRSYDLMGEDSEEKAQRREVNMEAEAGTVSSWSFRSILSWWSV